MIFAGIDGLQKMRFAIYTFAAINILESLMVMAYRISYDLNKEVEHVISTLALKLVDPIVKFVTFFGFVTIFMITS